MSKLGKKKAPIFRTDWPRIRGIVSKGRTYFQVDPRPSARRETFSSLTEANTRADQLAKDRRQHGKQGLLAPLRERVAVAELADLVRPYGKTVRQAVETAIVVWEEEKVHAVSVPMAQALAEWQALKEQQYRAGKLRLRTIGNLRPLFREFTSAFGHLSVLAVSADTIKTYEGHRPSQARTILTKRAKLSEFFRFTLLKGWRHDNPIEKLHGLAPVEAKRVSVSILSVKDCADLLEKATAAENAKELIPYVTVCLFAGLRPSEAELLDWRQIHFETRQIEVLADTSKNAENRFVPIEDNLLAWLEKYRQPKGPITPAVNWRRKWDDLRIAAGYALRGEEGREWPDDVLRHSYASYWLAINQDRARLAEQMGNSVEVIRSHYRRAIQPAVAKAFWAL